MKTLCLAVGLACVIAGCDGENGDGPGGQAGAGATPTGGTGGSAAGGGESGGGGLVGGGGSGGAGLTGPGIDCDGLNVGLDPLGQTPASAPDYLQSVTDPLYGTTTTRVTGAASDPVPGVSGETWGTTRHHYSSAQAWNADGTVLWLSKNGTLFLDGSSYAPIHGDSPSSNYEPQWSPVDPNVLFLFRDNVLIEWNVHSQAETTIQTVAGYSDLRMEVRTSPSYDGRVIGVKATRDSDGREVCFLLDKISGARSADVVFVDYDFVDPDGSARRCSSSPSGDYMWIDGYTSTSFQNNTHFFDWDGVLVSRIPENDGIECTAGHGDLGLDLNGEDVLVGVCKGGSGTLSTEFSGRGISYRARDGFVQNVGPYASHTSCRNSARIGWCFGSSFGSADAEIVAIRLDDQRVEHIANAYRDNDGEYEAEPHAVPAPSGTKVVFTSDWNGTLPKANVFVVDFSDACVP